MVPEIKKILYATDLSATARYAARYACSIGHQFGAQVTVLHVIPDVLEELSLGAGINLAEHMGPKELASFNTNGIGKARAAIHQRIRETSRQVTLEIPQCPLTAENIIVQVGNPVRQILSTVIEGRYDLVVMGTHGHGMLERTITGSVASEVIRNCTQPVTVVRLPNDRDDLE